ncbi:MAG: sel1 repeat family protein [Proteobacteria bacterium]|nr:sel1 repeat family protein [Pseudomonadota bacterium]MBU1449950.1 sel1 repeat family protein [Pseudomonadota bacterium]MBU2469855.1 sel1 repeat family protein [Pseudomonadota bacterium]MBU2516183.1 sel1 repeat family protein [Pseudomonadota bacterium]
MTIVRSIIIVLALALFLTPMVSWAEDEWGHDPMGYLLPETTKQLRQKPLLLPGLTKRAESGEVWAQHRLAERYRKGIDAPQHFGKALEWYLRAANQGYGPAMMELAEIYSHTKGGSQDLARAYFWYSLAAANKVPVAASRRDSLLNRLTPAEIAKAQDQAAHWAPKPESGAKPQLAE